MNYNTQALVLDYVKYSEHAIIARLVTQHFGLQNYLVRGLRKQKKAAMGAFQPLVLLNVTVDHKLNRNLQYIKELVICPQNYSYTAAKQAPILVLVEVFKLILTPYDQPSNESSDQERLFAFIKDAMQHFHACLEQNAWTFVAQFMAKLSIYLGLMLQDKPLEVALRNVPNMHAVAPWIVRAMHSPYLETSLSVQPAQVRSALRFFMQHYASHFDIDKSMRRVLKIVDNYFV